jgi:hypothetical protein
MGYYFSDSKSVGLIEVLSAIEEAKPTMILKEFLS